MCTSHRQTSDIFHADIQKYEYPAGVLSDEGWQEIENYFYANVDKWPTVSGKNRGYANIRGMREIIGDAAVVGGNTKADDGPKYVGSFAKRFSQYMRKTANVAVPQDAVAQVGNIFSKHSTGGGIYYLDFTKRIDWSDGAFGDCGSCFWGCRSSARELLEDQNFRAVRIYKEESNKFHGIGRAWILQHPAQTDLWVIFNAYGPLQTIGIARLITHRHGLSYRKSTSTYNNGTCDGLLFINSPGVIIGPLENIESLGAYPEIDFEIDEDQYEAGTVCAGCGDRVNEEETYSSPDGDLLCEYCFDHTYCHCARCSEAIEREGSDTVLFDHEYFCSYCAGVRGIYQCVICEECTDSFSEVEGDVVCESCYCDECTCCAKCEDHIYTRHATEISDDFYCDGCRPHVADYCHECKEWTLQEDCQERNGHVYCNDCVEDIVEESEETEESEAAV